MASVTREAAATAATRLLILFPGALGDFLCVLPAVIGLQRAHRMETLLVANPVALELVEAGPFRTASIQRREVADLFADGPPSDATRSLFEGFGVTHSWTGYGHPQLCARLAAITGGTVQLHRFSAMRAAEHAVDYYARCVATQPHAAQVWTTAAEQAWAERWCGAHLPRGGPLLVAHPGSGSPRKNWEGFAALPPELQTRWRACGGGVVVLLGPAEAEQGARAYGDLPAIHGVALRQIAALLARASLYVGNDSGISHLAATVGTATLALFGPSDPALWAPRGRAVEVISTTAVCGQCGPERFCIHRLDPAVVLAAIERMATRASHV